MSKPDYNDPELDELLNGFCNGTLSNADRARLVAKIDASDDACRRYAEFVHLCVSLSFSSPNRVESLIDQKYLSDSVEASSEKLAESKDKTRFLPYVENLGLPTPSYGHHFNWLVFVAGVGTASFFSLLLFLVFDFSAANQVAPSPEVAQKTIPKGEAFRPIAYLTSSNGCNWSDSSTLFVTQDHGVQKDDELNLLEGIAEFRLSSGVSLSIEGPAGLVLTSPTSLVLRYGKVTAQVPWSAKDFKVLAGVCRFEACDAEFGISVVGGRVDAHAFSGKVFASNVTVADEVGLDTDNDQLQQGTTNVLLTKAVIKQGRALTLVNQQGGNVKITNWNKARPSLFATKFIMAGELPITNEYVKSVLASKPSGYWRFESGKNSIVSSEVPTGSDLNIIGDLRLSGTAGNRVAEFCPGSDCYLVSREPLDWLARTDYSFELWFKPSHVHSSALASMCATDPVTGQESHAFMLELNNSGRQQVRGSFSREHPFSIRFLHRSPPNRSYLKGTSCFSKDFYSVRRWQHVVAVKHDNQMQIFIDGKLSASTNDVTSLVNGLRLVVGRHQTTDSIFQFNGQLDELAIYSRALLPEEIVKHYEAVIWSEIQNGKADNSGI